MENEEQPMMPKHDLFMLRAEQHAYDKCGFCGHEDYNHIRNQKFLELVIADVIEALDQLAEYHQMTLACGTAYKIHNLASLKEAIGHIKRRYGRE